MERCASGARPLVLHYPSGPKGNFFLCQLRHRSGVSFCFGAFYLFDSDNVGG